MSSGLAGKPCNDLEEFCDVNSVCDRTICALRRKSDQKAWLSRDSFHRLLLAGISCGVDSRCVEGTTCSNDPSVCSIDGIHTRESVATVKIKE